MLTLHADRGAAMRSKPVASLLVDLDVAKSHSRSHVSDDNAYSESQFKAMKYRPEFPERFGSIEDARAHCRAFFAWYKDQRCHSGIGYMTPHSVHYRLTEDIRASAMPLSTPHSWSIQTGSRTSGPGCRRCPQPSGSTRHRRRKRRTVNPPIAH